MTMEQEVANLTTATTQLLAAVNVSLATLDSKVAEAEAAAAAVVITSGIVYPDEATGRAAVADGEYFKVVGNDYIVLSLYKRNTESSSTLIASQPSDKYLKEMENRYTLSFFSLGLSPYLSFDDQISLQVIDMNGIRLDTEIFLQMIVPQASPYMNFNDMGGYDVVDKNGFILNGTDKPYPAPFTSFDDQDVYIMVDMGGFILNTNNGGNGSSGSNELWAKPIFVEFTASTKTLSITWIHDKNLMLKTTWSPNGHNSLFNFRKIDKAPIGNPVDAVWTNVQAVGTDYIPPITHNATTGSVSSNVGTTGGNHAGANNEITAWMRSCTFLLNDIRALTTDYKGYANSVKVTWVNELCAGNTVTQQRVTTRQDMQARFTKRNVEVQSKVTALEPIKIYREGGTQIVGTGWDDSFHFYGGIQKGSVPYNVTSGTLSARVAASTAISGKSVAGRTIIVTKDGTNIGSTTVESDGSFSVPLSPSLFYDEIAIVKELNGSTETNQVSVKFVADGGSFDEAPDQWACVLKSNELGYVASWIDRSWGNAVIRGVDKPSARNTGSYKFYNFTVRDESGDYILNAGQSYSWRGGYSYAPADIVDTGLDSGFIFNQQDKLRIALASSLSKKSGKVKLPEEYISGDFEIIGGLDSIGTNVVFSDYAAKSFKETN